jgi:hypothetical protein
LPLEDLSGRPSEVSLVKNEIDTGPGDRESTMEPRYDENSLYTFKEKNTSQPSLHYSEELFQLIDDNEQTNLFAKVIKKAILYGQQTGQRDDYFTKDDFVYALIMLPNENWSEDKAEQTFNALLEDGKIRRSYYDNQDLQTNSN